MLPPSSGLKGKPRKKPAKLDDCLLHAGFLLGLLFNLKDEGDMFLRNVG
jgi:hypothetical protein